jgi:DNA repair protein RecO (recombination protein O)
VKSYKCTGIVIRRFNVGEADRLLDVYTPRLGKIHVKAKGVRRPRSKLVGQLEIFSEVDLVLVPGKSTDIITGARTVQNFQTLGSDLQKTAIAYYFCELVYWLTEEGHKDTQLYKVLKWALLTLAENTADFGLTLFVANVELLLLDRLGYRPELEKCALTGRPLKPTDRLYFSAADGGVITKKTTAAVPVSAAEVKVLRIMISNNVSPARWRKIPEPIGRQIKSIGRDFIHYTLERRLKTESFLELTQRRPKF